LAAQPQPHITRSTSPSTEEKAPELISEKASPKQYTAPEIAESLWLHPEVKISEDTVQKVNAVDGYLKEKGFQLKGVKADGNCLCNAFLGSYRTAARKIPLLDDAENQVSFLREQIAGIVEKKNSDRAKVIRKSGEWITALDEGDLLARALKIPIRLITINKDREGCGISDTLTFPEADKPQQTWETLGEQEKPKEYILIVDLGGHFVYGESIAHSSPGKASVRSLQSPEYRAQIPKRSFNMAILPVSVPLPVRLTEHLIGRLPQDCLDNESKVAYSLFFQNFFTQIEPLYKEKFSEDYQSLCTNFAPAKVNILIGRILDVLQSKHPQDTRTKVSCIFFRYFMNNSLETLAELGEFQSFFQELTQTGLARHEAQTGERFSSPLEMMRSLHQQRLHQFLQEQLRAPIFSAHGFLTALAQEPTRRYFYDLVRSAIRDRKDNCPVLGIFHHLIRDYISPSSSNLWRHSSAWNYSYQIPSLDEYYLHPETPLSEARKHSQRMENAAKIISHLERVWSDFPTFTSDLDTLISNLPYVLFVDPEVLTKFVEAEDKANRKVLTPKDGVSISIQTGILEAVIDKILERTKESSPLSDKLQDIRKNIYFNVRFQFEHYPLTQKLRPPLTREQIDLSNEIGKCLQERLQDLYKMDREKNKPLIGIGFSGPDFENVPTVAQNKIFLTFSSAFRSTGAVFLYAARVLIKHFENFHYSLTILEDPLEDDLEIFNYITDRLLENILENPSIHPNILKTMQGILANLIRKKITDLGLQKINVDESAAKIKSLDEALHLLSEGRFSQLKPYFPILKEVVDEGKNRICIEPVISPHAGNPYTLSFMYREATEPAHLRGVPFKLGDWGLNLPCRIRCQLFSIAHTLVGEITHF